MSDTGHKSVVDGELLSTSPTAIQKFDAEHQPDSGCQRRWWFRYVEGLPDPAGEAAEDGTRRHKIMERWSKGEADERGILEREMSRCLPEPCTEGIECEKEFEDLGMTIDGVPLMGYMDRVNDSGVWIDNEGIPHSMSKREIEIEDYKFTGNLAYAKTAGQLPKTTQMVIYGRAAKLIKPEIDKVRLSHLYGQTKRKVEVKKVSISVPVTELDEWCEREIVPVVRLMKYAAAVADVQELQPNLNACNAFHKECPFIKQCMPNPIQRMAARAGELQSTRAQPAQQKESMMGSLRSKINEAKGQPAAAAPVPEVSPPDAPASDPVLAVGPEVDGQFYKAPNGQLFVAKSGKWTIAGAKSRAEFEALQTAASPAAKAETAKAIEPAPALRLLSKPGAAIQIEDHTGGAEPGEFSSQNSVQDEVVLGDGQEEVRPPKAKAGPGRTKRKPVEPPAPAPVVAATEGLNGIVATEPPPAKAEAQEILCFAWAVPNIPTVPLEPYLDLICEQLAKDFGVAGEDIRCSDHEQFKFGKWKGSLSMMVRANPPQPGSYRLLARGELYETAVAALAPMCALFVRGVQS